MIAWLERSVGTLALPLAILLTLLFAASCSSDGAEETATPPAVGAQEALHRSLQAMTALQSYRVEIAVKDGPSSVTDFSAPKDYHQLSQPSNALKSEAIVVGDIGYFRRCEEIGTGCSGWKEEPSSSPTFTGFLASFQWPLVALEMTEPTELFDAGRGGPAASLGVRGSVDLAAAVQEAQRREQHPDSPPSTISTFASTIEIAMSPADFLTHRITISSAGAEAPAWTITYSGFNQVTVEPPA